MPKQMRDITVTKLEFDEFLFPFVTNSAAENDKERATAMDVLRLLKSPEFTEEEILTETQIDRAAKINTHIWPGRELLDDEHKFTFEEEEYRFIRKRLTDAIPGVNIIALDDFSPLLDKFNDAEKYTVSAPEEVTENVA